MLVTVQVRSAIPIAGAALSTLLGGCAPDGPQTTVEGKSAITSGTVDENDSAVVALLSSGSPYCTGTLVAERWVLTAAHCLQATSPSEVYFGTRPPDGGQRVRVARTIIHPRFNIIGLQNDVGLVELAGRAEVKPLPLLDRPLDGAFTGSMVRLVGFGATSSTDRDPPLKRTGSAEITAVEPQKLTLQGAPSQPCLTDSGAPALREEGGMEYVVGVSSSGDAHCQQYARAVRVDLYADDFILPAIAGPSYGCRSGPDEPGPALPLLALALALFSRRLHGRVASARWCGRGSRARA